MWRHIMSTFLIIKNLFLISSCCKKEEVIFLLSTRFPILVFLVYNKFCKILLLISSWCSIIFQLSSCNQIIFHWESRGRSRSVRNGMSSHLPNIFLLLFQNHISKIFQSFQDNTNTILLLWYYNITIDNIILITSQLDKIICIISSPFLHPPDLVLGPQDWSIPFLCVHCQGLCIGPWAGKWLGWSNGLGGQGAGVVIISCLISLNLEPWKV